MIIDPPNPVEGDVIRVGLQEITISPCFEFPEINGQGLSHLFNFDGNYITLTAIPIFQITICTPIPVTPAPREYYNLGELPVGTYNLRTQISDPTLPLPVPEEFIPFLFIYGPDITFEVKAKPRVIDTLGNKWLVIYILILLFLSWNFIAHKKSI